MYENKELKMMKMTKEKENQYERKLSNAQEQITKLKTGL